MIDAKALVCFIGFEQVKSKEKRNRITVNKHIKEVELHTNEEVIFKGDTQLCNMQHRTILFLTNKD